MKHTEFLKISRVRQEAETRAKDSQSPENHILSFDLLMYRKNWSLSFRGLPYRVSIFFLASNSA